MKALFFIIMFPCLASAGPYYEVVSSTTVGTATMTVSGYIGVAASSTTPTTYKFRIDGPNGYIQFPDGTKQTSAAAPGNYVLKSGDTMTGQLTLSGSTLTVTGNAFSVGGSTLVVKEGNVGIGTTAPGAKLEVKESGTETYTLAIGTSTTSSTYDVVVTTFGNVGIGTKTPGVKLEVAGSIKSTMWAVSKPIAYTGSAYPRSGTFTSNGGTLMIFASAGAYHATAGSTMQVDVKLDTVVKASLKAYTNEANSHKMLCSDPIVLTGIGAGSHTVELVLVAGSSDANDYSQVTVLELPF